MAKTIKAEGKTYSVPDDATDAEINEIVGPAPTPAAAAKPPGLMEQARTFTQEHPKITAAASMLPGIGPIIGEMRPKPPGPWAEGYGDPNATISGEVGKGVAKQIGRDAYGLVTSPALGPIGSVAKYLGDKTGVSDRIQKATETNNPQQDVGSYATTGAEMALPLPKAIGMIPNKARAGENLALAMQAAKDVPVDVSKFAQPALRAQQLNARTGDVLPPIMRKAIGTINPTTDPLTYEAARDMASASGRKAVRMSMQPNVVSGPMGGQMAGVAKGLDEATAEAAQKAGVGDIHNRAMNEYRRASQLEHVGDIAKKAAIGVGTGAGLYEVGKPLVRKLLGQ